MEKSYAKKVTKVEDDVVEFTATFKATTPTEESVFSFGSRDDFKRMTSFQPVGSSLERITKLNTYLLSHVFIADCSGPRIVLRPRYLGRSWIFMNSVAFLADGVVQFEKRFEGSSVDREILDRSQLQVQEVGGFVLDGADIEKIRLVTGAQKVVVRFTGEKGYVNLDKKQVETVLTDMKGLLRINDALEGALKEFSGESCQS